MREGRDREAEQAFLQASGLAPQIPELHANVAFLMNKDGRRQAAETAYRRALDLAPAQVQILINFGAMLAAQKRFAEAETVYRKALAADARSLQAWSNLGVLLASQKRETEAESCYLSALSIAPDYATASFNLAYILLRQGRYEEGWRHFESRDWYAPIEHHLRLPRWHGEALSGKSLIVGLEAGHGDMIQFCRYAPLIKKLGASRLAIICRGGSAKQDIRLSEFSASMGDGNRLPRSRSNEKTPP